MRRLGRSGLARRGRRRRGRAVGCGEGGRLRLVREQEQMLGFGLMQLLIYYVNAI
jgi:hypothetical protein